MRIALYTCFAPLFGRLCRSWAKQLTRHGHQATIVELRREYDRALPVPPGVDVNLFMGGISMLRLLQASGFPERGKSALWMFEPLTEDATARKHGYKAAITESIIGGFDTIIGMDEGIVAYAREHFPNMPTHLVPFTIDREHIQPPLPEGKRKMEVLQLGRLSARRKEAESRFAEAGVPAWFIYDGLYTLQRYEVIAKSKISLQIYSDAHRYFDQHRTFEAWSLGSAVVSEPPLHPEALGVVPGQHMAVAELGEMPAMCRELLADRARRRQMAQDAQALLRERYTPEAWIDDMLAALS